MVTKKMAIYKSKWFLPLLCFLAGGLLILGIRFTTYKGEEEIHYHANFAMYINGQREQFASPIYYIDVTESCAVETQMTPHERAHLHDEVNDVVHVEDHAVTWGQFFQNLGWVVDNQVIRNPSGVMMADANKKVTFILNGKENDNIINREIKDEDKLLVDYGETSAADLQTEYASVPATAHKYDITQDPESCSGHKGTTMRDRMTHMF